MTAIPVVDREADPSEPWRIVDAEAPPERLAMLRILTGAFAVAYLSIRLPVYLQLADRESGFDGVGVASALAGPVPDWVVFVSIGVTFVSGLAFTVGCRWKRTANSSRAPCGRISPCAGMNTSSPSSLPPPAVSITAR